MGGESGCVVGGMVLGVSKALNSRGSGCLVRIARRVLQKEYQRSEEYALLRCV